MKKSFITSGPGPSVFTGFYGDDYSSYSDDSTTVFLLDKQFLQNWNFGDAGT